MLRSFSLHLNVRLVLGALMAVFIALSPMASAQESVAPETPGEASYVTASYSIAALQVAVGEDRTARGTFTLTNNSANIAGDVRYKVQLLGPLTVVEKNTIVDDNGPLYFQTVSPESLSIGANSLVDVTFSTLLPTVPGGSYRLRIQTLNSKGREDAWQDVAITMPGDSTAPFARAESAALGIPGNDEPQQFRSGPNTPPQTEITVPYTLSNPGTQSVVGVPELIVYEFAITRPVVTTVKGASVTVAPGKTVSGQLKVTTASKPEAYEGHLRLVAADGSLLSTDAEYRWVVVGESAEIMSAEFSHLGIKAGETTSAFITVVGAADGITTTQGTVTMTLLDGDQAVASHDQSVALTQAVVGLEGKFVLDRDITDPGLLVEVKGSTGTVLDTYQFSVPASLTQTQILPTTSQAPRYSRLMMGGGIALVIIALGVVVLAALRKRTPAGPPTSGTITPPSIVVLLLLSAGLIGSSLILQKTVQAAEGLYLACTSSAGVNRCQDPGNIRVFINSPTHGSTSADAANINFSYRVEGRSSCGNNDEGILEQVQYLASGGNVTPHNNQCGSWSLRGENWVSFPGLERQTAASSSVRVLNRTATLDLTNPHPGASTTIRLLGWRTDPFGSGDNQCNSVVTKNGTRLEAESWHHGYLWLNLTPPVTPTAATAAQCSDSLDNDGDNKIDSNDPGCHTDGNPNNPSSYVPTDNDETNSGVTTPTPSSTPTISPTPSSTPPQCSDNRDNDNDNRVDCNDPGCWSNRLNPNSCVPTDNDESDPECSDARDNDGDGNVDQNDIGCRTNPTDPSTYNPNDPNEADPVLSPGPIQETE